MRYEQQSTTKGMAHRDFAFFPSGMVQVGNRYGQRIEEDLYALFEGDTVTP
jgi:hypothetical protein